MMKKIGVIFLILNILIIDGLLVYWFFVKDLVPQDKSIENLEVQSPNYVLPQDACGSECQKYIDNKIAGLNLQKEILPTQTPAKSDEVSKKLPTKTPIKSVSYLPISGTGSTTNTDWTTLSGTDFYMTKSDYPGITGVYFEANIKLLNGNGRASLRVFDVTHSIGVVGSEISTSSQTSTFVTSGPIYLWEGYNHYVIQAKSLTADTAVFESGRLKIITQN